MSTEMNKADRKAGIATLERRLWERSWPTQIINRDLLKYIAVVLMTMGHWALDLNKIIRARWFLQVAVAVQFFAPPVFFFFIAEGYHYTGSKKKYALRLLIFAVITQVPHALAGPYGLRWFSVLQYWSVLMTLFLGLMSLIALHGPWELPLRLLVIAACMGISYLLKTEWAVGGICLMLLFDLLRERPLLRFVLYIPLVYAVVAWEVWGWPGKQDFWRILVPMWSAGVAITFFYSGKRGHFPRFSKYFFYVWYPLHLLLQWWIF